MHSTDHSSRHVNPCDRHLPRWLLTITRLALSLSQALWIVSSVRSSASFSGCLTSFVAFQVFFSNQGGQGILGKPSKQQLENVFGTSVDVDVITFIIQKGKEQSGDTIHGNPFNSTNVTRGGAAEHRSGNVR